MPTPPRILLLMGVAGSGKTVVGRQLATELGWPYFEADDFHSAVNKARMGQGTPLTDEDRAPWLAAIRAQIDSCLAAGQSAVFTCSALKQSYRDVLMTGAAAVKLIYLQGDAATIATRVGDRSGHYMKANMVESQFAALEPPTDALTLDIRATPAELVEKIRQALV